MANISYVYDTPMTFTLKETILSLSGDSFDVKDQHGKPTFKVKGKAFSLHDKKTLSDMDDKPLYKMKESPLSLHRRQTIFNYQTEKMMLTMKRKSIIPAKGLSTVLIWKGDNVDDEAEPLLVGKGDIVRREFDITDKCAGKPVVHVTKKGINEKNLAFGQHTYETTVEPGYDASLMVMLTVAIDEVFHDSDTE